eukprot:10446031-Ditylum_brightwellii.AAC.1
MQQTMGRSYHYHQAHIVLDCVPCQSTTTRQQTIGGSCNHHQAHTDLFGLRTLLVYDCKTANYG